MVANIGVTQSPVTNTFQPGVGNSNDRVGTAEQKPKTNQVEPRQAPTAESQRSEEKSLAREDTQTSSNNAADQRGQDTPRGSIVDIEV